MLNTEASIWLENGGVVGPNLKTGCVMGASLKLELSRVLKIQQADQPITGFRVLSSESFIYLYKNLFIAGKKNSILIVKPKRIGDHLTQALVISLLDYYPV